MIYAAERGSGKDYRHVKAQIPYQGNTAEPLSLLYREHISQINMANKKYCDAWNPIRCSTAIVGTKQSLYILMMLNIQRARHALMTPLFRLIN
jgi:hypothetical protein